MTRETFGDWEIDLVDIANQLERIAESYVYEDDDENDEKHDPSDGPFVVQEPEETDDFADLPIFDSEDFEQ